MLEKIHDAEILGPGDRTDDEWEKYIRDASVEHTILDRGVRWMEFYNYCYEDDRKRGGSHFSIFARSRFKYSQPTAARWVAIGRGKDELIRITNKLAPDWYAMYEYLRLSDDQKAYLLDSDELISQKTIKALKGTRGDHSSDAAMITDCDPDVRRGDFREVLADIPSGTVNLILTDPPYPVEHIELWSDLGKFAADKLANNGMLVAYTGKYALPEVLNRLSEHLNYWWLSAIFLTGSGHSTPLGNPPRKIISQWRPLVMFVKHSYDDMIWDVVPGGDKNKDDHNWGQSLSEAAWIVDHYARPGELVVDPMAGSGTVAKACRELGRRFIGAEINAD